MKWIWFTGIWLYPPVAYLMHLVVHGLSPQLSMSKNIQTAIIHGIPILISFIVTWTNWERKQRGQIDFSFGATYGLGDKDERHTQSFSA